MHTPPAPAAIAGAIRTFAFLKTSTASGVQGMFEPEKNIVIWSRTDNNNVNNDNNNNVADDNNIMSTAIIRQKTRR